MQRKFLLNVDSHSHAQFSAPPDRKSDVDSKLLSGVGSPLLSFFHRNVARFTQPEARSLLLLRQSGKWQCRNGRSAPDNKQIPLSPSPSRLNSPASPTANELRESCTVLREKFPPRAGKQPTLLRPTNDDELAWSIDTAVVNSAPFLFELANEVGPSYFGRAVGAPIRPDSQPARSVMTYAPPQATPTGTGWGRSTNGGFELKMPRKD